MKKRILSINGNKPMNFLLQTVLSKNYDFIPVSEIVHGIHELKNKQNIWLILIDIDNQSQESWDFIQHIKTSSLYRDKKIIILTSGEIKERKWEDDEYKEYTFFYKPFSPLDIKKTIDELMFINTVQN